MQANLNEIIPLLCVDQATRWESGDYVLVEDYYEQASAGQIQTMLKTITTSIRI